MLLVGPVFVKESRIRAAIIRQAASAVSQQRVYNSLWPSFPRIPRMVSGTGAGIQKQRPWIQACPASFGRGQHGMTKHVKALRRHYTNIYLDNHPPFVLHNSYEYESLLQRAELLFLVLVRQGYAPRGLLTPKLGQTGHGCITHGPFYFEGHDNHGPFCLPRKGE